MMKTYLLVKFWLSKNLVPVGLLCFTASFFFGKFAPANHFMDGFLKGLGITLIIGGFLRSKQSKKA